MVDMKQNKLPVLVKKWVHSAEKLDTYLGMASGWAQAQMPKVRMHFLWA